MVMVGWSWDKEKERPVSFGDDTLHPDTLESLRTSNHIAELDLRLSIAIRENHKLQDQIEVLKS